MKQFQHVYLFDAKKNSIFVSLLLIGILALSLVVSSTQAKGPATGAGNGTILILDSPDLNLLSLPKNLSLAHARMIAQRAMTGRMSQVMDAIRLLQAQGLVGEAQVIANGAAIRVQDARQPEKLYSLEGVRQAGQDSYSRGCLEGRLDSLSQRLVARSLAEGHQADSPQEPDVDLTIYLWQYKGNWWTYSQVYGKTSANQPVNMKIRRGEAVIVDLNRNSESDGFYSFEPDWLNISCSGRYSWTLQKGDVVEVSISGTTEKTTFVDVYAWIDSTGNTLQGYTVPNRTIGITLYHADTSCIYNENNYQITSDAGGYFSRSSTDINGLAQAEIRVYDSNNNRSEISVRANQIAVETNGYWFGGYWKPSFPFHAELIRGASVISTVNADVGPGGEYSGFFSEAMQPGDEVHVNGGGYNQSYVVVDLSGSFNLAADAYNGFTAPGRMVYIGFEKAAYSYPIRATCSEDYICREVAADGTGSFGATASFDLVRGDTAYLEIYDPVKNLQYASRPSGFILSYPAWDEVEGIWERPGASLTINLRDSGSTIKDTQGVTASTWDGYFGVEFSANLVAGDQIEVFDGITSLNAKVENLTVKYASSTEHVTGNAPSGHLLAFVIDSQPDKDVRTGYCNEMSASGAYDFNFSSAATGPWDRAEVFTTGLDGNYTYGMGYAFSVWIDYDEVTGYTESPGIAVTIKLWNGPPGSGSTVLETETTTSSETGGWYVEFSTDFQTGYVIEVLADKTVQLKIPNITINFDPANNAINGNAPANGLLHVIYWESFVCSKGDYSCGQGIIKVVTADSGGSYSASFKKEYLELWGDHPSCKGVQFGNPCSGSFIDYFYPSGHKTNVDGPIYPAYDNSDSYETDNTPAEAKAYNGPGIHNFHTESDVDWISIVIGPDQVNKILLITTTNLGGRADPVIQIYAPDGVTLLAENDDGGNSFASSLEWIPISEGTYYIKAFPYSSSNADSCSSAYTLSVNGSLLYLPNVARQE